MDEAMADINLIVLMLIVVFGLPGPWSSLV